MPSTVRRLQRVRKNSIGFDEQQSNTEIDLSPSICSHKEGHAKGIASNHGDPEHLWKGLGMSYTMDTFRQAVNAKMSGTTGTSKPVDAPFLVRVSISNLNIRKGAGTNYAATGRYTGKGVFTITEVKAGKGSSAGWGRLKSGAGWISLDYAKRV